MTPQPSNPKERKVGALYGIKKLNTNKKMKINDFSWFYTSLNASLGMYAQKTPLSGGKPPNRGRYDEF